MRLAGKKACKQLLIGVLGNDNKRPQRQGTFLAKAVEKYLENIN